MDQQMKSKVGRERSGEHLWGFWQVLASHDRAEPHGAKRACDSEIVTSVSLVLATNTTPSPVEG